MILDYYTHQKYFVIQGTYNGVPNTNMVLTGSSNWASLGTAEDEVFFTIQGRNNAKRYLENFNSFWNSGRWSRNAYTTTYTDFRVARMERQADGSLPEGLRHRAPPGDHGRARPLQPPAASSGKATDRSCAGRPARCEAAERSDARRVLGQRVGPSSLRRCGATRWSAAVAVAGVLGGEQLLRPASLTVSWSGPTHDGARCRRAPWRGRSPHVAGVGGPTCRCR